MKNSIYLFAIVLLFTACEKLEQIPQSSAARESVFGSVEGLELYSNSFYNILPSGSSIYQADNLSDYVARRDVPRYVRDGAYSANLSDNTSASAYDLVALGTDWNWGWGALRNVNYFIVNINNSPLPADVKNDYLGIARFFRAFFYFEKVKRYGNVPWISKPLDVNDKELYKGRDSRTLVMDSVLADLDFASQNIKLANDPSRSRVTKWVALALKSRVCLFEGTFRKYHSNLNLTASANAWLENAASAAKRVMDEGGFKLFDGSGAGASYRNVFIGLTPNTQEVLMASISNVTLGVLHPANWYFTSATTGVRLNFIRTFINTYLNIDGTPFTNKVGYETTLFKDEVKGRDRRLEQTIRMGSYKRINGASTVAAPPVFTYSFTGYMPIKWSMDDVRYDAGNLNDNAVPLFRYAEVLLNFAEAKAELGTLTDAEWAISIGALRKRAGITGGLSSKPIIADTYLQTKYFPSISDPVILEVRRERGIELCLEGFRFYDIVRWKRGELMTMEWNGMYVPTLDTPMDLNEDGVLDVAFYKVLPSSRPAGVTYINVSPTISGAVNAQRLSGDNFGELTWQSNIKKTWTEKLYYYPIPQFDLNINPALTQNSGW